jgi:hypothetical protein
LWPVPIAVTALYIKVLPVLLPVLAPSLQASKYTALAGALHTIRRLNFFVLRRV